MRTGECQTAKRSYDLSADLIYSKSSFTPPKTTTFCFSVLDNYLYTEDDVFKALSELEEALKTPTNVSFYSYGKIIGRLTTFRKILDYDYSEIKELMKANLAQFSDNVDVRSLFRFGTFQ